MVGAVVHPGEEERGGARTCAIPYLTPSAMHELLKASVLMQILSYPTETALSNKLTWNRILSWSKRLECFAKQDPGRARQSS